MEESWNLDFKGKGGGGGRGWWQIVNDVTKFNKCQLGSRVCLNICVCVQGFIQDF